MVSFSPRTASTTSAVAADIVALVVFVRLAKEVAVVGIVVVVVKYVVVALESLVALIVDDAVAVRRRPAVTASVMLTSEALVILEALKKLATAAFTASVTKVSLVKFV